MRVIPCAIVGRAALLISALLVAPAQGADWSSEVKDLAFGEAAYQLYQEQYFQGLVHLSAAKARKQLPQQEHEADLLLGAMYISYGMPQEAERVFQYLTKAPVPAGARDKAWLQLAKVLRARGLPAQSLDALTHIKGKLDEPLEQERMSLSAAALIDLARFGEAVEVLHRIQSDAKSASFVRFNFALALLKAGKVNEGLSELQNVCLAPARDEQTLALRDRCNLSAGYLLNEKHPAAAIEHLRQVRLEGPFGNRALLGLGKAYGTLDDSKQALDVWLKLQSRDIRSPIVQQGVIATGNAYEFRGSAPEALAQYQKAIDAYTAELDQLARIRPRIAEGRFLEQLIDQNPAAEMGWFWRVERLPTDSELGYLIDLLASQGFQEGLKNLRDLRFLATNLAYWTDQISAFDVMLTAREQDLAQRLPIIRARFANAVSPNLQGRYAELKRAVDRTKGAGRGQDLADAREMALLARIERAQRAVDLLPADAVTPKHRATLQLARGLLTWDLETVYDQRLREIEKSLHELERALDETKQRRESLLRAQSSAPANVAAFGNQVEKSRQRLDKLHRDLEKTTQAQRTVLISQALSEIDRRQAQLQDLRIQAKFSAARVTDQLAHKYQGGSAR